ncbi:CTLH/CRA C-terminal to lish motif domain-containing protein [Scheffersomyces xylosifermentans]|uniref:CTLH/CRA C-terminal to lish motif domain-containing protein n=1 Tax=Scheffersomyces xylosifermentans TaxID=1304137 RepID=UPI00315D238B
MTNISKEKIDNLILNYFIQEGYQEAAVSFSKELNIDINKSSTQYQHNGRANVFSNHLGKVNSLSDQEFSNLVEDYFDSPEVVSSYKNQSNQHENINSKLISGNSTINQRKEIKLLILKGSITEAIKKISEYFPVILDSNNLLHFKLLRLNLIEMIRQHKLNSDIEKDERDFLDNILTFVRENLINKVSNSSKLLKELEITMSLLCFNFDPNIKDIEEQKELPQELRSLFKLSLRNQCYRLVNKAILNLYDRDDDDNQFLDMENNDKQSTQRPYKGPKFIEFDLSNLDKYDAQEEDIDDSDIEMFKDENIEYNMDYSKSLNQLISTDEGDDSLNNEKESAEDELNKLQSLTLESKVERIVKLWTITEQRLLDLNIIKEKRYTLNEEYL